MYSKFVNPPKPEEILPVSGLPRNAQKILEIYEDRALINKLGDTKIYDANVAKLLGVSLKTVYNCKQKLIKARLISTHTSKVVTGCGNFRTVQVIRCWRVMYRFKFRPQKDNTWNTVLHPPVNIDYCRKDIPTKFVKPLDKPPEVEFWSSPQVINFTNLFNDFDSWSLPSELSAYHPNLWDASAETRLVFNEELQQINANGEDPEIKIRLGLTDECRVSKNRWYKDIQEYREDLYKDIKDDKKIEEMVRQYSKQRNRQEWLRGFWRKAE